MESNYQITPHKKDIVRLRACSKKLFNDLVKLGITPNKTFTATPPKIPKEYEASFWKGVIDGDGHLGIVLQKGKYKIAHIGLAGTKAVCTGFSYFTGCQGKHVIPHQNIFRFSKRGKQVIKIVHTLYKNSTIHLNRKYKKYLEIMELV